MTALLIQSCEILFKSKHSFSLTSAQIWLWNAACLCGWLFWADHSPEAGAEHVLSYHDAQRAWRYGTFSSGSHFTRLMAPLWKWGWGIRLRISASEGWVQGKQLVWGHSYQTLFEAAPMTYLSIDKFLLKRNLHLVATDRHFHCRWNPD